MPDGRAYEMVSPPEKNGSEVIANGTRTRAAADGSAVQFSSLGGFGDVIGTEVAVDYMAVRRVGNPGDNGWGTHAITPAQKPLVYLSHFARLTPGYQGFFSEDLDAGVFRAWSSLPGTSAGVAGLVNLYVRDDLRTPGAGSYQLVTDCPLCTLANFAFPPELVVVRPPIFVGASEDFTHVVFEDVFPLTPDSTADADEIPNAFEWANGTVRLAGILPDGNPATPGSILGSGVGGLTPTGRTISEDGTRVIFTVSKPSPGTGEVYLRINGRTSVQMNASELASPESPQPAKYWDASTDMSRVFFSTSETLTPESPADGQPKLYMWRKATTDETQSLTISATGGTFALASRGQSTAPVAFDAPADVVEDALAALPTVGTGNVTVTGGPGGSAAYDITFTGDLAGVNLPQMTADAGSLTGGGASVATTTPVTNLTLVNSDQRPEDPTSLLGVFGASAAGDYVYFAAGGQLVAGRPVLGGGSGFYMWNEGTLRFIGETERFISDAPFNFNETAVGLRRKQSRVTPDGQHLLFMASSGNGLLSQRGGVDYDHGFCPEDELAGACRELYVYSADTDDLRCATCNPSGAPATASGDVAVRVGAGASTSQLYHNRAISDDGRYAFFSTREALVSEDVNGRWDAYEYDTLTERPRLLSSGADPSDSYFLDASGSGEDVYFVTREQLVGWDVDKQYDLYDARVGGGFPEPVPAQAPCSGDTCRNAPSGAPADSTSSSAALIGQGNPKPTRAKRCAKNQRKVRRNGKTRCVKKQRKQQRHNRTANNNRRTGR